MQGASLGLPSLIGDWRNKLIDEALTRTRQDIGVPIERFEDEIVRYNTDNQKIEEMELEVGDRICYISLIAPKEARVITQDGNPDILNQCSNEVNRVSYHFIEKITRNSFKQIRKSAYTKMLTFKYGRPSCAEVVRYPKIQMWGGDVRAGKDIITHTTKDERDEKYIK